MSLSDGSVLSLMACPAHRRGMDHVAPCVRCHLGKTESPLSDTTTPGPRAPWCLYGKRLYVPEAKTFMGRADLCVMPQGAGEGHSQRLECISEVGTLP